MELERELALLRESWTETFDQLFVLYEVAREVSGAIELETVLEHVVNHAFLLLESEAVVVFLVDQEKKKLAAKIIKSEKSEQTKNREQEVNIGEGIAGEVAQTGRFVIIPQDVDEKAFSADARLLGISKPKNLLCVPITLHGGTIIGVIEVVNRKIGTFTSKDRDFLMAIANISALSIENAKITRQLQGGEKHPGKLKENISTLTDENAKLSKQLQDSEKNQSQLTEKISALTAENEKISRQLQDGGKSQGQLTESISTLTAENAKLSKQLQDSEKEQGRLKEKISALTDENAKIGGQLQDSEKNQGQLTESISTLTTENAKISRQLQDGGKSQGQLTESISTLTAENAKIGRQLQDSEKGQGQLKENIAALTAEKEKISGQLQDSEKGQGRLKENIAALTAENAKIARQLQDSASFQGQLVENFPEGFVSVNHEGKITYMSTNVLKLLGVSDAASCIGQAFSAALKEETELLGFVNAALVEGKVQKWKEISLKKTGKMAYLFTSVFKSQDNSVLGAGIVLQDMILRR